mmetsp:Transcript_41584/g.134381  ORF Transcript_41584/g.134381 Transcript_41584/m.134381 type:complete len:221 (-) Transcript_41584:325-987(-)
MHRDHDDALGRVRFGAKQHQQRTSILRHPPCLGIHPVDEVDTLLVNEIKLRALPKYSATVVRRMPRSLSVHAIIAVLGERGLEEVLKVIALHEGDDVCIQLECLSDQALAPRLPPEMHLVVCLDILDLLVRQEAPDVVWPTLILELAGLQVPLVELADDRLPPIAALCRIQVDPVEKPRLCVLTQISSKNVVLRDGELQRYCRCETAQRLLVLRQLRSQN